MERHDPSSRDIEEDLLLEATLGWLFLDVHAAMTRAFDDRLSRVGLTRSQWRVMSPLLKQQGISQTTLAELVNIEKAPLGRTLDRLEKTGWVRREMDLEDRRARRVYLTDKIDPHIGAVTEVVRSTFGQALHGLKESDVRALMGYLMTIRANME